jgi:hypothetical protein
MTDLRVYPSVFDVGRLTADNGGFRAARATRDGALFVSDWKQSLIMEGRGYIVTVGAVSTPITGGGAGTTVDTTEPEFAIAVPSGTSILPIRVSVQCQVPLLATDSDESEIVIGIDRTQVITGGTSTSETIFNLRTDNPRASLCTATSAYTADSTSTLALGIELIHAVKVGDVQSAVGTTWGDLEALYEPDVVPIIMGPATLVGFWGGTVATTGFAQVAWLELPSNAFN